MAVGLYKTGLKKGCLQYYIHFSQAASFFWNMVQKDFKKVLDSGERHVPGSFVFKVLAIFIKDSNLLL